MAWKITEISRLTAAPLGILSQNQSEISSGPNQIWTARFSCPFTYSSLTLRHPFFLENSADVLFIMLRLPRVSGRKAWSHEERQTLCWPDSPSPTRGEILWTHRGKIRASCSTRPLILQIPADPLQYIHRTDVCVEKHLPLWSHYEPRAAILKL